MRADIVMLTKNELLAGRAIASIDAHVRRDHLGKLVIGWTGDDPGGEYRLLKYAADCLFEAYSERLEYNFAKNNNYLVETHCRSDAVLFMNDDVDLTEDSVDKCLALLERDARVGSAGIRLDFPGGKVQHGGIFAAWCDDGQFKGVGHLAYGRDSSEVELVDMWTVGSTGAFLMARAADFAAVGGFNEAYEHCFEDVELNVRLAELRNGLNVTVNSTRAVHAESSTRNQESSAADFMRLKAFMDQRSGRWRGNPMLYTPYEGAGR